MVWCITRQSAMKGTVLAMRLGVLDVGSNTVHMLVVDAYPGARPLPAFSHKVELSLAAHLEPDNTLGSEALRIA
jgi:exopolyphosphatase / guanosine-5'-triphosphate,3'-diphosphate pyrophosphatase